MVSYFNVFPRATEAFVKADFMEYSNRVHFPKVPDADR